MTTTPPLPGRADTGHKGAWIAACRHWLAEAIFNSESPLDPTDSDAAAEWLYRQPGMADLDPIEAAKLHWEVIGPKR